MFQSRGDTALKAAAFNYVRAATVAEASKLLRDHGDAACIIAGGQSLLPALNLRLSAPALLIDISRIPSLKGITVTNGTLRIAAATTHAELLASPLVAAHAPLLPRAVAHVAHPAIRSRGTIGGSLANADPAAELPACALALAARILVDGPDGARAIAASDFFTGLFGTSLEPAEIVTAVEIDRAPPNARWGFAELSRRSGDYAIVGLAAHQSRLAFFAIGTAATLATHAAAALDAHGIDAAVEALAQDLDPHEDLQASAATRLHLARVLLRRVTGEWTL